MYPETKIQHIQCKLILAQLVTGFRDICNLSDPLLIVQAWLKLVFMISYIYSTDWIIQSVQNILGIRACVHVMVSFSFILLQREEPSHLRFCVGSQILMISICESWFLFFIFWTFLSEALYCCWLLFRFLLWYLCWVLQNPCDSPYGRNDSNVPPKPP